MPKNPLAEVFGFPVDNMLPDAVNHRQGKLCPYHNSSGMKCTKNSASDPLGVCAIFDGQRPVVTCPVRMRQDFTIIADAIDFFFPGVSNYQPVTEVRLKDKNGKSAGNIDIVIAAQNDEGDIVDFGAVEIQTVYISGNVTKAFREYMKNPAVNCTMEWPRKDYPRPDYLSSSRKKLIPQLSYKGGIIWEHGKKMAIAIDRPYFEHLPRLKEVHPAEAEIVWLVYDFSVNESQYQYRLERYRAVYTQFQTVHEVLSNSSYVG
jgi:hypothetical protein